MGFFAKLFGSDSGSDAKYNPASYVTSIPSANVSTSSTISKAEEPKKAEIADTSAYDEGERRRKRRNGVRGSFGFTGSESAPVGGSEKTEVGS